MIYLIIFFTSLVLTVFITPLLIDLFTRIKIVDMPGGLRRINTSIVPRMGGFIIYFIVIILTIIFYGDLNSIRFFVLSSVIIVALGMVDDIIGVKWNHKFIVQFFMSIYLIIFLSQYFNYINFFGIRLYYPFSYILLIIFIVGVINSFNLLDGLDGLVSGFSLMTVFVTFSIGLNTDNKLLLVLSSGLMGALLGFLKFNAYPAKIFLGDTGAYALGFFIVTAAIIAATNKATAELDLTFPVILLAVPILDTLKVMVSRLINKHNPFLADQSHIHHLILSKIPNHKFTVFIIESIALLFAVVSLYYSQGNKEIAVIIFVILAFPVVFIRMWINLFRKPVYPLIVKKLYNGFPQVFIKVYTKFFIPVIAVISIALLIGIAPLKSDTNENLILLSIFFLLLLFIYSLINYQRNKYFNDILVFFNVMLFLIYSNYTERIHYLFDTSLILEVTSNNLLILMLLPSVVFFLFFREKILMKKVPLFSGIDLIILVFIMLLSVSSSFLPGTEFSNANLVLFNSFLIYIFYKVFVLLRSRYQPVLFYLSFAIPVIVLIHLLITH